jgi:peptidoglycan hydrolase-like protein with peptidoglycan-binding domain
MKCGSNLQRNNRIKYRVALVALLSLSVGACVAPKFSSNYLTRSSANTPKSVSNFYLPIDYTCQGSNRLVEIDKIGAKLFDAFDVFLDTRTKKGRPQLRVSGKLVPFVQTAAGKRFPIIPITEKHTSTFQSHVGKHDPLHFSQVNEAGYYEVVVDRVNLRTSPYIDRSNPLSNVIRKLRIGTVVESRSYIERKSQYDGIKKWLILEKGGEIIGYSAYVETNENILFKKVKGQNIEIRKWGLNCGKDIENSVRAIKKHVSMYPNFSAIYASTKKTPPIRDIANLFNYTPKLTESNPPLMSSLISQLYHLMKSHPENILFVADSENGLRIQPNSSTLDTEIVVEKHLDGTPTISTTPNVTGKQNGNTETEFALLELPLSLSDRDRSDEFTVDGCESAEYYRSGYLMRCDIVTPKTFRMGRFEPTNLEMIPEIDGFRRNKFRIVIKPETIKGRFYAKIPTNLIKHYRYGGKRMVSKIDPHSEANRIVPFIRSLEGFRKRVVLKGPSGAKCDVSIQFDTAHMTQKTALKATSPCQFASDAHPKGPGSPKSAVVSPPPQLIRRVQASLAQLGYAPGTIDGVMGRKTRDAIEAFQREAGLPATGAAMETLAKSMEKKLASRPEHTKPTTPPPAPVAPRQTADLGTFHALIIGNDAYRALPRLRTAVKDAHAVAELLQSRYGFRATTLTNATRAETIQALQKMRGRLTERDNLLVYYAGHGKLDRGADRGYWLPVDADEDSPVNWINNVTVTDAIKAIQAKHVMVVADSCYSGTLTRDTRGVEVRVKKPDYVAKTHRKKSRTVLASGGLEPVSDSGGSGHSVFAKAFMDVLRDNETVIDGHDVFSYVRKQVRLNADQVPNYTNIRYAGHEVGGDFLFARKLE